MNYYQTTNCLIAESASCRDNEWCSTMTLIFIHSASKLKSN